MNVSFWDERYGADAFAYGREPNEFLRAEATRIPPGRVLCLAEGEGRNAVYLAQKGYDVTAVDFSLEGLRKAERLAKEVRVDIRTVQADLATYELERDTYSGIVSIFAHVAPKVRQQVHGSLAGALQRGGVFLLEAYTPTQVSRKTGGPRDPAWCMTLEGVKAEIGPLELVIGREVDREIHEGTFHTGLGSSVQLVATRVR